MAYTPGVYDAEARALLVKEKAVAVIVMVLAGNKGTGFSFCTIDQRLIQDLPGVLRNMADSIQTQKTAQQWGMEPL